MATLIWTSVPSFFFIPAGVSAIGWTAANINGVLLPLSFTLTSALASISSLAISVWPFFNAQINGVSPSLFFTLTSDIDATSCGDSRNTVSAFSPSGVFAVSSQVAARNPPTRVGVTSILILCRVQNVSQNPNPKSKLRNPKSKLRNPKSEIQNPKSQIQNPKSEIQNPKSEIQNPKSEIQNLHKKNCYIMPQNPKSKIRTPNSKIPNPKIRNPKSKIQNPKSKIQNPKSKIRNPKSKIQNPNSKIKNPKSKIQIPKSKIGPPEAPQKELLHSVPKSKIQIPKSPNSGRKSLDFGFWIGEFWILDSGFWIPDFGSWILEGSRECTTRQFGDGAPWSQARIPPGPPWPSVGASFFLPALGKSCWTNLRWANLRWAHFRPANFNAS